MFELYYFKVWELFAGNYYCIISFEFLANQRVSFDSHRPNQFQQLLKRYFMHQVALAMTGSC